MSGQALREIIAFWALHFYYVFGGQKLKRVRREIVPAKNA